MRTLAERAQAAPDVIASRIAGHYFQARHRALLDMIGAAMGKDIADADVTLAAVEEEYDRR